AAPVTSTVFPVKFSTLSSSPNGCQGLEFQATAREHGEVKGRRGDGASAHLDHLEIRLAGAAVRAHEGVGNILPAGARRNALLRQTLRFVVDKTTVKALPLLHCPGSYATSHTNGRRWSATTMPVSTTSSAPGSTLKSGILTSHSCKKARNSTRASIEPRQRCGPLPK